MELYKTGTTMEDGLWHIKAHFNLPLFHRTDTRGKIVLAFCRNSKREKIEITKENGYYSDLLDEVGEGGADVLNARAHPNWHCAAPLWMCAASPY